MIDGLQKTVSWVTTGVASYFGYQGEQEQKAEPGLPAQVTELHARRDNEGTSSRPALAPVTNQPPRMQQTQLERLPPQTAVLQLFESLQLMDENILPSEERSRRRSSSSLVLPQPRSQRRPINYRRNQELAQMFERKRGYIDATWRNTPDWGDCSGTMTIEEARAYCDEHNCIGFSYKHTSRQGNAVGAVKLWIYRLETHVVETEPSEGWWSEIRTLPQQRVLHLSILAGRPEALHSEPAQRIKPLSIRRALSAPVERLSIRRALSAPAERRLPSLKEGPEHPILTTPQRNRLRAPSDSDDEEYPPSLSCRSTPRSLTRSTPCSTPETRRSTPYQTPTKPAVDPSALGQMFEDGASSRTVPVNPQASQQHVKALQQQRNARMERRLSRPRSLAGSPQLDTRTPGQAHDQFTAITAFRTPGEHLTEGELGDRVFGELRSPGALSQLHAETDELHSDDDELDEITDNLLFQQEVNFEAQRSPAKEVPDKIKKIKDAVHEIRMSMGGQQRTQQRSQSVDSHVQKIKTTYQDLCNQKMRRTGEWKRQSLSAYANQDRLLQDAIATARKKVEAEKQAAKAMQDRQQRSSETNRLIADSKAAVLAKNYDEAIQNLKKAEALCNQDGNTAKAAECQAVMASIESQRKQEAADAAAAKKAQDAPVAVGFPGGGAVGGAGGGSIGFGSAGAAAATTQIAAVTTGTAPAASGQAVVAASKASYTVNPLEKRCRDALQRHRAAYPAMPKGEQIRGKLAIKRSIQQVSGTQNQITKCTTALKKAMMDARNKGQMHYSHALVMFAENFVQQGQNRVDKLPRSAFPFATVALSVIQDFPDLMDVLLGVFHEKCIYSVPKFPRLAQYNNNRDDYLKACSYAQKPDGSFETRSRYIQRMTGFITLYAAMMQTQTTYPNPHGIAHAWQWLARVLSYKTPNAHTLILDCLNGFLKTAGYEMSQSYRRQFPKFLQYIKRFYTNTPQSKMPGAQKHAEAKVAQAQLGIFMEEFEKTGRLKEPEGRRILQKIVENPFQQDNSRGGYRR